MLVFKEMVFFQPSKLVLLFGQNQDKAIYSRKKMSDSLPDTNQYIYLPCRESESKMFTKFKLSYRFKKKKKRETKQGNEEIF